MASYSSNRSSSNTSSYSGNVVQRASVSRERVLKSTKGKYSERGTSDPKKISLNDRIKQFPGESLCLRNGKLFCGACKELLSSKKSILGNHVASRSHDSSRVKMKKTKKRDQTITEALRQDNTQSKDCMLPVEERAYRLQVVEEFLKAGIPLRKIDKF